MSTVIVSINGITVKGKAGATILDTARSAGVEIPALCQYPRLDPLPQIMPDIACRLCMVEADGKIVLSCNTAIAEGMVIQTDTPRVRKLRRRELTALLRRYPYPPPKGTELDRAIRLIGEPERPTTYMAKGLPMREDSPFFVRDNNLCILCGRCVRVCSDIRMVSAIEYAYPCHRACPAGIDIPRYIRLIGRGRPSAALAVIREKVPFPGSLGRVCVHPCEQACQRGRQIDKPLSIRMLKRYAADHGDDSWKRRARRDPPTGKSVAIIGAGPAGLTAAYYLARKGHRAVVFESLPQPGGMMRVGIPEYRLPRDILAAEIRDIEEAGVEIKLNHPVESIDSLLQSGFNAVFIGIGSHKGMPLGVDGDRLPGVIDAAEYLRRVNLGERIQIGEKVGVVGGGNVAIDAARISLRLGAKKVTIFYRRTRAEMPANPEEIEAALEENIEIMYLVAPSKVTREGNKLKLECIRMELGAPDASGRRSPVPIKGSEFITELDTIIAAIGQRTVAYEGYGVALNRNNTIKVNEQMMTSRSGVFAGGDCVTGPKTVIEAIAAGRRAAIAIDRYLGGDGDISESLVEPEEAKTWLQRSLPTEKEAVFTALPPARRAGTFEEVEHGFKKTVAEAEAMRCLQCHVIAPPGEKTLEEARCQFCGACVDACPAGALVERTAIGVGLADRTVTTTCPYCGVGCQLKLEIKNERIARVEPDPAGPANKGQACVKGKFGMDFVTDPARLTTPLIKKNGKFVEASWEEAIALIASKLGGYKGDEFAAISSARCTNEENYVFQKFARAVMQTNTVDHCARL